MNAKPIRTYKTIAWTAVVGTATGFTALSIAAPASADAGTVYDQYVGVGGCPAAPPQPCGKPLALPFTTTQGNAVEVNFTKNPNSDCPNFNVQANFDGVTPADLHQHPETLTVGAVVPLALGNHTINLDASCNTGTFTSWGGHLVVDQIQQTGKPKPDQPAGTTPATAVVTGDVDVYSKPGGHDEDLLGFLPIGTKVNLPDGPKCPQDADCHISGPNVPTGNGYAWGAFFTSP